MKNLRDYEQLIRDIVAEQNDRDENWNWSIKSFSENLVRIRWGYLDYCQEEENCFLLKLLEVPEYEGYEEMYVTSRTPQDDMISSEFVSKVQECIWHMSYEEGIKSVLDELFYYAHSRY